jgi:hypothetical protein
MIDPFAVAAEHGGVLPVPVMLVNGCGPSAWSRCWRLLRCWPGLKVEAIPQRLL